MATLTERVLALTDQGFNFPTIAALLNITPAQVESVWEDASVLLTPDVPYACFELLAKVKPEGVNAWPGHAEMAVAAYPAGAAGDPDTPNGTLTLGPVALEEGGYFHVDSEAPEGLKGSFLVTMVKDDASELLLASSLTLDLDAPFDKEPGDDVWAEPQVVVGADLSLEGRKMGEGDPPGRFTATHAGIYFCTAILYIEPSR